MAVHRLKIREIFMEMKLMGEKKWEMRKDDRGFRRGDYVVYRVVNEDGELIVTPKTHDYIYRIDSVVRHEAFDAIPPGWCIWSETKAIENPELMEEALFNIAT